MRECAHCGQPIEAMPGPGSRWVHVGGGGGSAWCPDGEQFHAPVPLDLPASLAPADIEGWLSS